MDSLPSFATGMADKSPSSTFTTTRNSLLGGGGDRGKFAEDELTAALSLAASAIFHSCKFFTDVSGDSLSVDLLLLPAQSLTLDSSAHSGAASLARLFKLLRQSPQSLTASFTYPLSIPSSLTRPSWFSRFFSSSSIPGDPCWPENFRMSKPSFYFLLQTLAPFLNSSPTTASSSTVPTSPDQNLGAALFRLAHGANFRVIARLFDIPSPDLACRAFYLVCKAVMDHLGHLFELSSDLTSIIKRFHRMSLPNCCGALGFSRFCSSVIVQAVVDTQGKFLDVSAGWPVSMPPANILPSTKFHSSQAIVLACGPQLQLVGVGSSIPRYFIGGSCCPLLPWLLTPFSAEKERSRAATVFNAAHAGGIELVCRAFSQLRSRWQLLRGGWNEDCSEALPFVIIAACLLHNFLIRCGEPALEENDLGNEVEDGFTEFEGKGDKVGEMIRGVIASHLLKAVRT